MEQLEVGDDSCGAQNIFNLPNKCNPFHDSLRSSQPWVYGDETLAILRKATMERYALLPLWYSQFYDSHLTGMPVMRPLWMNYPKDKEVMALDSQWMVGER